MTTLGRKVFVIPARDWAGHVTEDEKDALHGRNVAALTHSLRDNGLWFRAVVPAGVEPNADGVSVDLIYDWTD